jgi:toxin HigB-1
MIELAFADESLRELCSKKLAAELACGVEVARSLRRRLADLRAAENVAMLVTGNARIHDKSSYIIDIHGPWRLIVKANHSSNPVLKNKEIDWARVTRVQVTNIRRTDET